MKEPNVGIIDYSIGNLFSVYQSCLYVGIKPSIITKPEELKKYDGIILPGVGAFGKSMDDLRSTGMDQSIKSYINLGRPFFGVCLGMQLLFDSSIEFGGTSGLGLIKGNVLALKDEIKEKLPVPKVTWDNLIPGNISWRNTPLDQTLTSDDFYFVHSFFCRPDNFDDNLALAEYGSLKYCAAVLRENIFATQFHPEKSGTKGLMIYKNWKDLNFK